MTVSRFLHAAGLTALAAALAATALPASAQDESDGRRNYDAPASEQRQDSRPSNALEARARNVERRSEQRATQVERRSEQRATQVDRRSEQRAVQIERRGDRAAQQAVRQGDPVRANRIDQRTETVARRVERRGDARATQIERGGTRQAGQGQRNTTYVDPNRNRSYGATATNRRGDDRNWRGDDRRGDDRRGDDRNWRGNDRRDGDRNWRNGNRRDNDSNWRDGRRDNPQWGNNDRRDHRRWDRNWRNDSRYDWRRHRDRNRVSFNLGIYYSPYRTYSYRRLGIGYFLDSLFFGSSYWISDPWQYRLPEVYGPYRWVRYYDDVLLVDIYTGEVVDVIYDFFW